MALSNEQVRSIFEHLRTGHSALFFENVAEDVDWTVMGTHPLAGRYHSKTEFLTHTFRRLDKVLKEGVILKVNGVLTCGDTAVVEMESLSTAKNGRPFHNTYCWIARFQGDRIVEVRAYLDSALVERVIRENEPAD